MDGIARDISWSSIPTDILLAELSKRQDADSPKERPACGTTERGAYDTPLHVFALILILALSTIACGFPLFSRQSSKGGKPNRVIFLCQHFGTGVLLATAFVHLLPTAFNSLNDPCLPYFFSEGYPPMPGLIAMASALVVVAMESYLSTRGAGHSHSHHVHGWDPEDESAENSRGSGQALTNGNGLAAKRGSVHRPADIALAELPSDRQGLMADVSPFAGLTPTSAPPSSAKPLMSKGENDEDEDLDFDLEELDPTSDDAERPFAGRDRGGNDLEPTIPPVPTPEEQKRLMIQCMLLEAGILFHSVFIGMAVSVATGPPFVVFLIAIAFHQTFEGLALGSRIAGVHFPKHSVRPWLMVLAYGTTTPIGQIIGLIMHRMYDPMSQTGRLMVGTMNAISSGLLLFAGLVQLLAEDFLTEKSYKTLKGRNRTQAFSAVVAGAALMAIVGAFA
ncbi:Zinc/iron permease [Xylariales sp. PMI_506]|nr:Zinc/iron permease [Xylariales sp. PMI_506]